MADTKVLVVDDSLTMRALITRVLDAQPGIRVVGSANGAEEARVEVDRLKPDVMTLDVEMPGMSGIEYLAELMEKKPMPVVMFSTRTEAGASSSIEALRLGAIDCFPKPKVASQSEFDEILGKLGTRIRGAKVTAIKPVKASAPVASFVWNGRMLVMGTDASGTQKLFDLLGRFPANCPPTLIVAHLAPELIDGLIVELDRHVAPTVTKADDLTVPEQGKVYITRPGAAHVGVDQWPGGRIRQMPRDPIGGERPSISLLFAAQAKAASDQTVALLLTDAGEDGGMGLKAVQKIGGYVVAPPAALGEGGTSDYMLMKGNAREPLAWGDVAARVLKLCAK
ncbi:chemotaxis protein CheB [Sphingomonas nostoxanthinifaciens]|uniref:chemotaxis protein CheB n=1 Tax=Sphingomonas nostoxanthinifaciens TaxID=2872652 RepID=UPI001CC201B3|nr:chemotaxis protein CheB [Sphingomonas nostoxanthinifaciens]UAK26046.1 response regulator [Sphingomonas nostoxanthinifaciens]